MVSSPVVALTKARLGDLGEFVFVFTTIESLWFEVLGHIWSLCQSPCQRPCQRVFWLVDGSLGNQKAFELSLLTHCFFFGMFSCHVQLSCSVVMVSCHDKSSSQYGQLSSQVKSSQPKLNAVFIR